MSEEILKIEIPVEEETPFVPEQPNPRTIKSRAGDAGRKVAASAATTAQKAWESDARKKVTGGVKRGATAVAKKGTHLVQEKMVKVAEEQAKERVAAAKIKLRETDWKHEAQSKTAQGLSWLSQKLSQLAARFTPKEGN